MNVIAMPETAVEAISAEAVTVETEAAGPATSLIPDTRQIPLSKLTASKKNVRARRVLP